MTITLRRILEIVGVVVGSVVIRCLVAVLLVANLGPGPVHRPDSFWTKYSLVAQ